MNKILNFHCDWMQWSFWGKELGQYKISSIFRCINKAKSNCLSLVAINITGTSHKDLCTCMISHGYSTLLLRQAVFSVNYDWRLQKQAVQNTALANNWLKISKYSTCKELTVKFTICIWTFRRYQLWSTANPLLTYEEIWPSVLWKAGKAHLKYTPFHCFTRNYSQI